VLDKKHKFLTSHRDGNNAPRYLVYQADSILVLLSQSQDTAGANRYSRIPDGCQGVKTIIVRPRRDDLRDVRCRASDPLGPKTYFWIELPRCVQIVVICAQTSLLQSPSLFRAQHPQRRADCRT